MAPGQRHDQNNKGGLKMGFFDNIRKAIHTATAPNPKARYGHQSRPNRGSNHRRRRYPEYPRRDPQRKLTKNMERDYNHLIAKIGPVSSVDEGIQKLNDIIWVVHPNHSKNFFNHPYVINTLKLGSSSKSTNKSEEVNWWNVESNDNSTTPKSSVPTPKSIDICGEVDCNKEVSAFDFRCFTCRKRYCDAHKGAGIDCKYCESQIK